MSQEFGDFPEPVKPDAEDRHDRTLAVSVARFTQGLGEATEEERLVGQLGDVVVRRHVLGARLAGHQIAMALAQLAEQDETAGAQADDH